MQTVNESLSTTSLSARLVKPLGFVAEEENHKLQKCFIDIWGNEVKAARNECKSVIYGQTDRIFMKRILRDLGKWGTFTTGDAEGIYQIHIRIKHKTYTPKEWS